MQYFYPCYIIKIGDVRVEQCTNNRFITAKLQKGGHKNTLRSKFVPVGCRTWCCVELLFPSGKFKFSFKQVQFCIVQTSNAKEIFRVMYTRMNRSPQLWSKILLLHSLRPAVNNVAIRAASSSSTTVTVNIDKQTQPIQPSSASNPRRDPLDLSFNNAEAAFRSKSTLQVLRAYLVFTLCSSNYLVENNMKVLSIIFSCFFLNKMSIILTFLCHRI